MKSRQRLIQGNFKPSRGVRQLRLLCLALGAIFVLGVIASVVLYGVVVRYETGINRTASLTRKMNEDNRNLQARLNRLQSFQNVESAAAQAPTLRLPDEVIEVAGEPTSPAPLASVALSPRASSPKIYGY